MKVTVYYAKAFGNPGLRTMRYQEGYGDGLYPVESYCEKEFKRLYPDFHGKIEVFREVVESVTVNGIDRLFSIPGLLAEHFKTICV